MCHEIDYIQPSVNLAVISELNEHIHREVARAFMIPCNLLYPVQAFSKEEFIKRLMEEGYTREQAEAAWQRHSSKDEPKPRTLHAFPLCSVCDGPLIEKPDGKVYCPNCDPTEC